MTGTATDAGRVIGEEVLAAGTAVAPRECRSRGRSSTCAGCPGRDTGIETLLEELEGLRKENERLREENERLRKENAKLEGRTRRNSRNSSLPPSSDPPSAPEREKKARSERKPGGQPGHRGTSRELAPPEAVHEVILHFPEKCAGCGKDVEESEKRQDPAPAPEHRHQQWEIPPIEPVITEHQCHTAECRGCGTVTRATLPESVARSAFGPNLMALVVLLTGVYRLSKRAVANLLSDVLGMVVSVGSISNIEKRVSRALAMPVEILKVMVRMAKVVYADETTWKERAKRMYIWTAVTCFGAVYLIRNSRASQVARELLGDLKKYGKYVITDRYSGYSWIPLRMRQICWAHLIRDFKWIEDSGGGAGRIGKDLLDCAGQLFGLWHRVRDGTLKRSSFRTLVSPIRKRIRALLEEGAALDVDGVSGMCRAMLRVYPAFYTFVRVEGVEPTNNQVERRQRHPAMWRRVSFGTWSRRGSVYVERILSTVATLRIQGRDILSYLREASRAALAGEQAPFLVPFDEETDDKAA